jgi:hypothetical protein
MYDRWPMTGRRERFLRWFRENRRRTEELFSIVDESCYYERPIPLRHPLVFYEGHLPGFNVITHVKGALGMSGATNGWTYCSPAGSTLTTRPRAPIARRLRSGPRVRKCAGTPAPATG